MRDKIKKLVVNDYFTPNIRVEVVLDTLLTPYISDIVNKQCKLNTAFVTKEMSVFDESRKDKRGEKIDYILAGVNAAYLVELKTTDDSIDPKQAQKYLRNCDENKTFGDVFGRRLMDIMCKKPDSEPKGEAWLEEFFEYKCAGIEGRNCTERAKKLRKKKRSTNKYLYTMGQLLDYLHKYPNRTLWDLPLKLIYVTPTGSLPDEALRDREKFYLCPEGKGSVSLWTAAEDLRGAAEDHGDELAGLLADIIIEIYGE